MFFVVSAVMATTGCHESNVGPLDTGKLTTGPETVSIHQLARILGLRVAESTSTHFTLKNSTNTVIIFTFSGGKLYVNGKSLGAAGRIDRIGGQHYVSKSLTSQIRSAMTRRTSPVRYAKSSGCVVIDAGHGGKDPGAISCLGFHEKTVNLAIATKVASLLRQKGHKVVLTRANDRFIELEERAAIGNRSRADLFVSLHSDSSPSSSRRGFTMYVARSASWTSRRAAGAIARTMSGIGLTNQGTRRADYRVLVKTTGPAVLVEMGYLSNRSEASLLRNNSFQNRIARAIANGISDFLG